MLSLAVRQHFDVLYLNYGIGQASQFNIPYKLSTVEKCHGSWRHIFLFTDDISLKAMYYIECVHSVILLGTKVLVIIHD